MKRLIILTAATYIAAFSPLKAQDAFNYQVQLLPITVTNLQGLHSYAFAQHQGKWLIIGGRKDGIHARQPFNSFPAAQNNTDIYVIDAYNNQFWKTSVNSLPIGLREQLQSTNMNFYQSADTLYIIGGYAFAASANDHITHDKLTTVQVSGLVNAIINGNDIAPYFKQISGPNFAVTGGQLKKIGDTFYLVGGQRFDGRYNPNNNPTFTQTYTNQVRMFKIFNHTTLYISDYNTITDPVHLHRRDYNLLPQIFPDGSEGLTISSGVFQTTADLPYLYPVDIIGTSVIPRTQFNQYLSNYHSAVAYLYDSVANQMHNLFFGGMSQYYYQNNQLIQDNNVPFVRTISRLTRYADGSLQEFQLPVQMPGLKGASAEFIPNKNLPHTKSGILKLSSITADTFIIGHIYGGLLSPSLNPFTNNQTNTTSADNSIYAVRLIRSQVTENKAVDGNHSFRIKVSPNPVANELRLMYALPKPGAVHYHITSADGRLLQQGQLPGDKTGTIMDTIILNKLTKAERIAFITVELDHKYFDTQKIIIRP